MPLSPLHPPPLVGRERELVALQERHEAVLAGEGSLVLIGGEAGIGKTALAESVCWEANQRGALVLVGRCYDLSETPPYGPWVELFGRYRPGNGDPPGNIPTLPAAFAQRGTVGEVTGQGALFQQTLDFLAAVSARRAVVLLLDDLHWTDPASLDLLRVLARAAPALPLLIIATYRSDEVARSHPLYPLLPQLIRESRAERVDLRPFDDEAVRSLVQTQYHLPDPDRERLVGYLRGRAEGNALFTGELLRSLGESGTLRRDGEAWRLGDLQHAALPPLLRQVIDRRVARLDAESRRVLALAAVVRQEAPLAVLGPLAETDDESLLGAVEAACEANLLIETADGLRVRFTHALIREAVYEGISPARRRLMHRRIGELLTTAPQPDGDAVAAHFQRASDRRVVIWLIRAGERAQLAYAWLTAIERYEAALALVGEGGGEMAQRGWLHYRIGSLRRSGTPERGISHFDAALRIAAAVGDRALVAAARYTRGLCLTYTMGPLAGIPEMTSGADALEALPPEEQMRLDIGSDEHGLPVASNPRGFLICVLATSGRIAEAIAMGEEMREGEPRRTPLGELGWAYYGARDAGLAIAYALAGRPAASDAAFARARDRSRRQGNYSTLGSAITLHLLWMHLRYHTDRPDDRERLAEEATAARRLASMTSERYERIAHLPVDALAGRWAEAKEGAGAALRVPDQQGWSAVASAVLAEIARAQGVPGEAWAHIRAQLPSGARTVPGSLTWWPTGLAVIELAVALALDAGDLITAREWLEAHDRWLAWTGATLGLSERHALWARYYRLSGDREQARIDAERAVAHATEPRQPLALLTAHRLLGELDTEAGRHQDAAHHLNASLALADACAAPFERALTVLAAAQLHLATDAPADGGAFLEEARAICTRLDAKPTLALADALAAKLDTMRATAPAYPAGLSAREVEVLRLVAQGLTNPQVAERLSLSPRTVGQHLSSIYTKLGVATRAAATRFAVEQRLLESLGAHAMPGNPPSPR